MSSDTFLSSWQNCMSSCISKIKSFTFSFQMKMHIFEIGMKSEIRKKGTNFKLPFELSFGRHFQFMFLLSSQERFKVHQNSLFWESESTSSSRHTRKLHFLKRPKFALYLSPITCTERKKWGRMHLVCFQKFKLEINIMVF